MIFELSIYTVTIETPESSKIEYFGINKEEAESTFEILDIDDFYDREKDYGGTCILWEQINEYKFIYTLDEGEDISDYPIDEYYDNSDYYELINEGMNDEIDSKEIEGFNKIKEKEKEKTNNVLNKVVSHFKNKYPINEKSGYFTNPSFYFIIPIDDNYNMELRISNHSMNPDNIERNSNIILDRELVRKGDLPKKINISNEDLYEIEYYENSDYVTYKQVKPKNRCYILSAVIFYEDDETEDVFDSYNKDKNLNWKQEKYDLSKFELTAEELITEIETEINELQFECEINPEINFQLSNVKKIKSAFQLLFFNI